MTTTKTEIMPYEPQQHTDLVARIRAIEELRNSEVFIKGVHFGEPYKDAGKEVLLKAGAETIMSRFQLWPEFIERSTVEQWDSEHPLFHYRYECRLIHRETGLIWGAGIGSCNSMEDKYSWRWVREHEVPQGVDKTTLETRGGVISEFDFAIEKAETAGKYGKPAAYWKQFQDAIENGEAREIQRETRKGDKYKAWEINATEYRLPNLNVFTLVNTIDKMAQKRALVAAVLIATGASAYFTQDVEDFPEYAGVVYDGESHIIEQPAMPKTTVKPPQPPTPPAPAPKPVPQQPPAAESGHQPDISPADELDAALGREPDEERNPARETPEAAFESGADGDMRTSTDQLNSTACEHLAEWLVEHDPRATNVHHTSAAIKRGLIEMGKIPEGATWRAVYDCGFTVAEAYRAFDNHYETKAAQA